MKKGLLIFCILLPFKLFSQTGVQFAYSFDNSIPLKGADFEFETPWIGGLNASQFNTLDLNSDGKDDLAIFDRTAQKVLTFLQLENEYVYSPEYEKLFPDAIYNWLQLRDFNGDGKKDIFTGHIFGISVYKNVSSSSEVKWEHFPFYDGSGVSEVVLTNGLSGKINLQMQFDDLPSISDADGDGDLDVFAMNYGGNGVIELHKNFSQEKYGHSDSLDFEMTDPWWGGVTECNCGTFAFDYENCSSEPGRVKHAGGKSLLLIDGDGDGVQDMLITEGECSTLYLLKNSGTDETPVISQAVAFPISTPAEFDVYPTAHFEDLDFDGVRDLLVSPNVYSKSVPTIEFDNSNWFYKNMGTNLVPDFQFQTKSFLQNQMLDLGDNSVPAFADFDGDGDFDLFVSRNCTSCSVILFLNTGSASEPRFELFDEDFLSLSQNGFTNMRIKFLDIDANGTNDLVFQATNPQPATKIFFIRNKEVKKLDFSGQTVEQIDFSVAGAENISFVDVNQDGKQDILKGKSNGSVEYWKHTTNNEYVLETAQYLGISASVVSTNITLSAADLNRDGKSDLILGDQSGKIKIVSDFRNVSDISNLETDVVYNNLTEEFYSPNLGGRIWPTTADLYGNGFPVIIAGTTLGGIRMVRNLNNVSDSPFLDLFPNPVHRITQQLTIRVDRGANLEIFSAAGQKIRTSFVLNANVPETVALNDFAAGLYILRFVIDNKIYIRRLIVY